ncbi:Putative 115 kDa protein in type-1 retrotransposable element R1DM [Eumeta japonica]|uniref:115 kDa protein in type-1 retrotransposable element R1DM n=1 Tax=Eumeta variegata TaxID=151549 RepID=A0A4C1VC57_EUMVA|nr:Putative 115 kDa protein in type-1 retrotransposable element R1DM [Eumeta japonica]
MSGRELFRYFPCVSVKLSLDWVESDYETSQLLTGHGCFRKRLHELGLNETRICMCGLTDEDMHHVIEDSQLVGETKIAAVLVVGSLKLGIVFVYYEGDQGAKRSQCVEPLRHANLLNPKGDKICSSIVGITACSLLSLGRVEGWKMDKTVTTSIHNAITYEIRVEGRLEPLRTISTRGDARRGGKLRHGDGLPARPGSRCPIRRGGVQEGDFEGLHTRLDGRSNLLESRPGLPTPRTRDLGVYVHAFADDVVLMFSGQSASALEAETNRALTHVRDRGDRNKLRFASSKTNAIVLTKKLKFDVPVIRMGNTENALVDEICLLGLTIYKRLTFTPLVAKACKKAANIYKGITRATKPIWGLSPEIVRTIYVAVIEPIVIIALKACRAYRTVSLHSALILARLLPLDIRVREAARLYEVKRGRESGNICADRELERPLDFRELPHPAHTPEFGFESVEDLDPSTVDRLAIVGPDIYTDGSKIEGKVDAALTEWRDGIESGNSAYRLEFFCTVFQAEMFALHRAIRRIKRAKGRLVKIFSDSKSSLQMLTGPKPITSGSCSASRHQGYRCGRQKRRPQKENGSGLRSFSAVVRQKAIRAANLNEWQQRYTEGGTGEITKCFFPRVEETTRIGSSGRIRRNCACAPNKVKDVLHVPQRMSNSVESVEIEVGADVVVARHGFPGLLHDEHNRAVF